MGAWIAKGAKLLLLAALALVPGSVSAAPPKTNTVTSASVDALVRRALVKSPSLEALEARLVALRAGLRTAGAWHDPRLSFEYSNMPVDAWRPGKHPMSGLQLKLSQTFDFPGKRDARRAVVRGRARELSATLAERRVQLRAMVRRAYLRLTRTRQLRQVTRQHLKLLAQFLDIVKVKYQLGKTGQHDYIRLQVLEKKLRDDLGAFRRDELTLLATLNATAQRPSSTAVATPMKLAPLAAPTNAKALLSRAERARPALRRLAAAAETHQAKARRAAREGYPNITAWLGYRLRFESSDSGVDFVGLGVSIPLPFSYASRHGARRDAERARARARLLERRDAVDTIKARLGAVLARWRRAAQKARTYTKRLMPLAHRGLDATFAAYQVDRASFASLYQAELQLLDFERAIVIASAETHLTKVAVEALIGESP